MYENYKKYTKSEIIEKIPLNTTSQKKKNECTALG